MRRGADAVCSEPLVEGPEVHLVDGVEDEEGQVVFVQPVGDRRRHEVQLVTLDRKKVVGHGPIVAIAPGQVVDLTRLLPGALQVADGRTPGIMQQAHMLRNFGYFPMECSWEEVSAKHPFVIEQVELLLPDQPRVPFTFLEVDWLKAQDHELELDSLYGPRWRASRDEFYSTPWITGHHSPAVVVREPWKVTNFDWDGSIDGP